MDPPAFSKNRDNEFIGECFGVEPSSSIPGLVHLYVLVTVLHYSALDCIS